MNPLYWTGKHFQKLMNTELYSCPNVTLVEDAIDANQYVFYKGILKTGFLKMGKWWEVLFYAKRNDGAVINECETLIELIINTHNYVVIISRTGLISNYSKSDYNYLSAVPSSRSVDKILKSHTFTEYDRIFVIEQQKV